MPKTIKGQTQLGKALGITQQAACKLLKHTDWPFSRRGPWPVSDVPKMQQWRAANLKPDLSDPSQVPDPIEEIGMSPKRQAEVKLLITRQAKLELERAILAGEYVKREDVDRDMVAKIHVVKTAIMALKRRLAPLVTPITDESENEVIIERESLAAISEIASR